VYGSLSLPMTYAHVTQAHNASPAIIRRSCPAGGLVRRAAEIGSVPGRYASRNGVFASGNVRPAGAFAPGNGAVG
jgi:hypothetical protein